MLVTTTDFRRALLVFLDPNTRSLSIHLFTNNHTPAVTDSASVYNEPAGSWYAPLPLTSWSVAFVNSSNQGEVDEVIETWIVSGTPAAESVYGYYVTDSGGNLLWAELNPAGPQPMSTLGQTFSVLPRLVTGDLC